MKILLFNGSSDKGNESTSIHIINYLIERLSTSGHALTLFNLGDAHIPFLDMKAKDIPPSVLKMADLFREADVHIWLSPLYHGGIPGAMKNCLDWLEITSKAPQPYLTGKIVGLVCWAGGLHAMQGINNMDAIAKALRAWVLPYTLPISRSDLFETGTNKIAAIYQSRLDIMVDSIDAIEVDSHIKV
ncbi:NAD(P)H-dependent oxidoreductase [Chitinophagaceae bacterium LB-8]|uniref:NAD(P)H-dependent oxidoreductase n=1 Tax=Paraflavisolibacter caeni TaxID=2982496 RepID=A0A9X2XZY2_9BACT|nr:NAD(P)H-dependent oxidoreductase [Paraflavisolibacter caeni]MCU7552754.1 NAD(P)H-dependent oxidoreductase [Paraflavisolibacter caeni]